MVLALEWGLKLELFGAKMLMGNVVSVAVIREIGPIITGIMVAGRTGAKMAAEIGVMKVTDQIDADNTVADMDFPEEEPDFEDDPGPNYNMGGTAELPVMDDVDDFGFLLGLFVVSCSCLNKSFRGAPLDQ